MTLVASVSSVADVLLVLIANLLKGDVIHPIDINVHISAAPTPKSATLSRPPYGRLNA